MSSTRGICCCRRRQLLSVLLLTVGPLAVCRASSDSSEHMSYVGDPFKAVRDLGIIKGQVEVREWDPETPFVDEIAAGAWPVLLKNTVASQWDAVAKWNPEYIEETVESFSRIDSSPTKVFKIYHNAHPMDGLDSIKAKYKPTATTWVNMSSAEFFAAQKAWGGDDVVACEASAPDSSECSPDAAQLSGLATDRYVYYGAPIEWTPELAKDIDKVDMMLVGNSTWRSSIQVWLGARGITTHLHYDIGNNFYLQVYGTKKLLLFPAADWDKLYLHPYLHPAGQSSQVNLDEPDLERYPLFATASAYEVEVNAGDVLHIPPLWGHTVVGMSMSASISVWSSQPTTENMLAAFEFKLPFKASEIRTKVHKALLMRLHLAFTLDEILGPNQAVPAVQRVLDGRIRPLVDSVPELMDADGRSYCKDQLVSMDDDTFEDKWESSWDDENEVFDVDAILMKEEPLWLIYTELMKEMFVGLTEERGRTVWVGDYIEMMAMTAVGNPDGRGIGCYLEDFVNC